MLVSNGRRLMKKGAIRALHAGEIKVAMVANIGEFHAEISV